MSSLFKNFTDEAGIVARAAWKWVSDNDVPSHADCLRAAEQHVASRVRRLELPMRGPSKERELEVASALAACAFAMISQFVVARTMKQWPVFYR